MGSRVCLDWSAERTESGWGSFEIVGFVAKAVNDWDVFVEHHALLWVTVDAQLEVK